MGQASGPGVGRHMQVPGSSACAGSSPVQVAGASTSTPTLGSRSRRGACCIYAVDGFAAVQFYMGLGIPDSGHRAAVAVRT